MATSERRLPGSKVAKMKNPFITASMALIASLVLITALADRMKERAAHDRFLFDESGTTELVTR